MDSSRYRSLDRNHLGKDNHNQDSPFDSLRISQDSYSRRDSLRCHLDTYPLGKIHLAGSCIGLRGRSDSRLGNRILAMDKHLDSCWYMGLDKNCPNKHIEMDSCRLSSLDMNHPSMDTSRYMSLDKNRQGKALSTRVKNTLDRDRYSSHYILVGPQKMAKW